MRVVRIISLLSLLTVSGLAQAPKIEGQWYGTINPPGANFDVAVNFQRRGDGWTGTLLMENGASLPLKNITAEGNAVSFVVVSKNEDVSFKGTLSNAEEMSGKFTQDGMKFPFKLSRTPTQTLQGASIAIDPNELISAIVSFSGPLSERLFVPPVTHPAIEYGIRTSRDAVATLMADIQSGKIQLKFEGEQGYLRSVLEALHIPVESQMAVFSKTSVQGQAISPTNPRV